MATRLGGEAEISVVMEELLGSTVMEQSMRAHAHRERERETAKGGVTVG